MAVLDPYQAALIECRAQALEDLAVGECASVCFAQHRGGASGEAFFDALEDRALAMSVVVSRVSIFESRAFDALDVLVRATTKDLRVSVRGARRHDRGIVALLDAFIARHEAQSLTRFDEGARVFSAGGDVHALCRAYIEASQRQVREAARIEAWLDGTSVSRVDRRTALRSLSFYCGGTLPRACVVTALTPDSLVSLRSEAPALLDDVISQKGTLPWEDATMFSLRLSRAHPVEVAELSANDRERIALRLYALHERVRGEPATLDLDAILASNVVASTPRALVRAVVDGLERAHALRGQ